MIVAVSTVKDTLANVRRFVGGNLANGIDHLIVHIDGSVAPEVLTFLTEHPHVTFVDADGSWWAGRRPPRLNTRQKMNANLARALLDRLGFASWLLHLDGDEIAVLDRDVLDTLGPEVHSINLQTLEAVAELAPTQDPVLFKRRLQPDELVLLHLLGLIDEPRNSSYFKGHLQGRPGVRPSAPLWLGVHVTKSLAKEPLEGYVDPGLRVLHFESPSGEEFVRKWRAMTASGPGATHHGTRHTLADAVRTLLQLDVAPGDRDELLLELFARARADDVAALRRLNVLEEVHPADGKHSPEQLSDSHRDALERAYAGLRDERKQVFGDPGFHRRAARVVDRVISRTPG